MKLITPLHALPIYMSRRSLEMHFILAFNF